ncbi:MULTISPECIES: hypothetical protein [Terrabacteria group]|uniref:hypothetical protein n=1 Tax=Bacillati TaxID=1783272 RepID=UPI001C6E959C|nr:MULTISPECIES: hypothetical protein [Terrabacteria group]MBW9212824.1 hypothetical protein [Trueperella sp. zg.1013]
MQSTTHHTMHFQVKFREIEELEEKINELNKALEKANSIIDELAAKYKEINIEVKV